MKSLNPKAQAIFDKLIDGLKNPGDSRKIDNSNGAFMAVHVECIDRRLGQPVFSIAHYHEQNGDLCCDPDMTFWLKDGHAYPLTFEQAGVIYQVAARVEGESWHLNAKLQAEITEFCNSTWFPNLREQQDL